MRTPPNPREFVAAVLGPGEDLIWSQLPGPRAPLRRSPFRIMVAVVGSVAAVMTVAATVIVTQVLAIRDPWAFLPVAIFPSVGAFVVVVLWLHNRRFLRTGLYAVTNRRLVILENGSIRSFPFRELGPIERVQRGLGRGDLLFSAERSEMWIGIGPLGFSVPLSLRLGFYDIQGLDEVGQLVTHHRQRAAELNIASRMVPAEREAGPAGMPNELQFGQQIPRWSDGIFLLIWGTPFAVGGMLSVLEKPWLALIFLAAGLGAIASGLWMLLWRDILSIDRFGQTYRRHRGWAPWLKVQDGAFAEFAGVRVVAVATGNRRAPTGQRWAVQLVLNPAAGKAGIFNLVELSDPIQASIEAKRLGAALCQSVDDSAIERKNQADAREREQDEARSRRLRPYKRAGWVGAGLLVVNALLPGIHWRDQWTDEHGNRYQRCSTLFRTLTRVETPDGLEAGDDDRLWLVFGNSSHRSGLLATKGFRSSEMRDYRWGFGFGRFPSSTSTIRPGVTEDGKR